MNGMKRIGMIGMIGIVGWYGWNTAETIQSYYRWKSFGMKEAKELEGLVIAHSTLQLLGNDEEVRKAAKEDALDFASSSWDIVKPFHWQFSGLNLVHQGFVRGVIPIKKSTNEFVTVIFNVKRTQYTFVHSVFVKEEVDSSNLNTHNNELFQNKVLL